MAALLLLVATASRGDDATLTKELTEKGAKLTETKGVVTGFDLPDPTKWSDDDFGKIGQLSHLQKLNFGIGLTNHQLSLLTHLPEVTAFATNGAQLDDDGVRQLAQFKNLTVLTFFHPGETFTGSGLADLAALPKLESLTIRERLDLHRRDEICASCHAKLDPYGLALENYDAIGQWRERLNGEGIRSATAPVLDVSGQFPDGKRFTTLAEFKAGLTARQDKFARAFSTKLLTYALGRPVGYTDHEVVDSLTATLKQNDYRIQPLILAIVASEPFGTK